MNEYIVTEAMNYLDDSLLNEATRYRRRNIAHVFLSGRTWGVAAACLLILLSVGIVLTKISKERGSSTVQSENAYQLVEYEVPDKYDVATLYVATVAGDNSISELIAAKNEGVDVSKAMWIFRFQGDEDTSRIFYYPVMENDRISRLCIGTKLTDGRIVTDDEGSYAENGKNAEDNILMSLSSLTSPENPLFLVTDGSTMYFIIGENAYCNDNWAERNSDFPEITSNNNWTGRNSNLPEINTEGLEIRTIAIELK